MYSSVTETRMTFGKGNRHVIFAHGCLSILKNTPIKHVKFRLHLTI
jgi:hypothetical protein